MPKQTFFNLEMKKRNTIIESAINEFSEKNYEQVHLSIIIKNAHIPRGSFYQYFEDKKDLYMYILDIIKEKKMTYLSDGFNRSDIDFLDQIELLYELGIIFAIDYPKYVKVFDKLLNNKNDIYHQLIAQNLEMAVEYYQAIIIKNIELGKVRADIDPKTLAQIVSELTSNVTIQDLDLNNPKESYQKMKARIKHIINILRKGIQNE